MQLLEVRYPNKPARFFIDGVRVSRSRWDDIKEKAYREGTLNSFHTQAKQVDGGKFVRRNYCCC